MTHKLRRSGKTPVCPSCQEPVSRKLVDKELRTCPSCGEWLICRGRLNQKLERFQEDLA